MKRLNSIIAFIMVIIMMPVVPAFAEEPVDVTPPEIVSFEGFSNDSIDAREDYINARIDLVEDGRGVAGIGVWLKDKVTGKEYYELGWDIKDGGPLYTGSHTIQIPVNSRIPVGEYSTICVTARDVAGNTNRRTYDPEEHVCDVTVTASEYSDPTQTRITEIKLLERNNLDARETLPVQVTIDAKESLVGTIDLMFLNRDNGEYYDVIAYSRLGWESGTYVLDFEYVDQWPIGKYTLMGTEVIDTMQRDCANFDVSEVDERTIRITESDYQSFKDRAIKGLSVSNQTIETPGVIHAELIINDAGAESKDLFVSYQGKIKNYGFNAPLHKTGETEKGYSIYQAALPVGPFTESGELQLNSLSVYSDTPGATWTSLKRIDFTWQEDLADITITSPCDITYFGALGNDSYLEKIKGMDEGETAVIDYTYKTIAKAEIFQAIAGKNKTIVFVDNEIQWVFNGLNIDPADCKDIDLKHKITAPTGLSEGFSDDERVIKIEYADNGKLPGEAQMRINDEYIRALYDMPDADLYLSYLQDNGDIVLEDDDVDMAEDEYYEYETDHNSDFALSENKAKIGKTTVSDVSNGWKSIKLTWQKTGGAGYYIYRSTTKNGKYTKIATVKSKCWYLDKDIKKGKTYYYKVKPFAYAKALNETARISDAHKAYTRLKRPAVDNMFTGLKPSYVKLEWNPVKDASKYEIYRSAFRNTGYQKIATVKSCSFMDLYLTHEKTYYYKVRAVHKDSKYNSDFSKPIEACSELRYKYTSFAEANLSIGNKTANVWVTIRGNTTKIEGTAYLQKRKSGTWTTIKKWTKSADGSTLTISKTKKVTSGKYRVKGVLKAYQGKKKETVTVFSRIVKSK